MSNPNEIDITETLFDESIRTLIIIWIAGMSDSSGTDEFQDFFDDHDSKELKEIFGFDVPATSGRRNEHEEILSFLCRKKATGFLVRAETPVPVEFYEDGGYLHHGFGHTTTKWFYTAALDQEFVKRLVEWKTRCIASRRKKEGVTKLALNRRHHRATR